MHIFPDLHRLEGKYARELAVVGVHMGKFTGEKGSAAIREAALRYGLGHPIVNDAKSRIWNRYGVRCWPTIVLIDTRGRVLGRVEGEGHFEALDKAVAGLIVEGEKAGTLSREPLDFLEPLELPERPLLYPGKVLADAAGKRLFVSDTNHHRVLELSPDGQVRRIFGSGKAGSKDGAAADARFVWPQGLALHGGRLLVADTEGHTIRAIDLESGAVSTAAGTGEQKFVRGFPKAAPALETPLNSPWDLTVQGDRVYIAMAGDHRLWLLDAKAGTLRPWAGNGRENIDDGSFERATFSQPSGIVVDGDQLWVADAEDSAIRHVDLVKQRVKTVVGTGLFDFGDVDGRGDTVRLQHPLHVVPWDGKLLVADTYNHKLKLVDPLKRTSVTFAGTGKRGRADGPVLEASFDEPSGLALLGDRLYVADTNNHALRVVDLATSTVSTLTLVFPGD